jgi:hypothetical protein
MVTSRRLWPEHGAMETKGLSKDCGHQELSWAPSKYTGHQRSVEHKRKGTADLTPDRQGSVSSG